MGVGIPGTQLSLFWPRLIIRNGNNVEAPPVYDSYEVEYLPIEGLLSSGRYFFVEFSTDSSGAAAGMALRYEGEPAGTLPVLGSLSHVLPLSNCILSFLPHFHLLHALPSGPRFSSHPILCLNHRFLPKRMNSPGFKKSKTGLSTWRRGVEWGTAARGILDPHIHAYAH